MRRRIEGIKWTYGIGGEMAMGSNFLISSLQSRAEEGNQAQMEVTICGYLELVTQAQAERSRKKGLNACTY